MSKRSDLSVRGRLGPGQTTATQGVVSPQDAIVSSSAGLVQAGTPEEVDYAVALAFPLQFHRSGEVDLAKNAKALRQSAALAVMVRKGEWFMYPDEGANLHLALMEPLDDATAAICDYHVREAIQAADPRLKVDRVEVKQDPDNHTIEIVVPLVILPTGATTKLTLKQAD